MRMGKEIPKQFLLISGLPVLMHTIHAFYNYNPEIDIILVLPEEHKEYWSGLCRIYKMEIPLTIVNGGETRFHSVKNALEHIPENAIVAIHDGVRPLVSAEMIASGFVQAEKNGGAFPIIPLTDSIRKYTDESFKKSESVDRSQFCLVQTPQVFRSEILLEAYKQNYSSKFTDDVSVVEASGLCEPIAFEGSKKNIKITEPTDLLIAESFLS